MPFQENGAFVNWAFVGGTALRFLYLMPRFSEDLDFSLAEPGIEDNFIELMKKAKSKFFKRKFLSVQSFMQLDKPSPLDPTVKLQPDLGQIPSCSQKYGSKTWQICNFI